METPKLPENQNALVAVPQSLEIVLAEGMGSPFAFVLPPFDDINEIEGLKGLNFSLREHVDLNRLQFQSSFMCDFDSLKAKQDRFNDSAIFASKLATLAHFAENNFEWEMLQKAKNLNSDAFYAHRFGEGLVARGLHREAEEFFSSLNLDTDLAANLRLAYFCIQQHDFDRANKFVEAAIFIDPFDFSARLFEGGLQLVCQNYQRAVQSFRHAIKERPGSAVAYCNIAAAYAGMRENTKALSSLKKSVALDPLNANALCFLSDTSFGLEKDEEALPSLRYYVQFEQKNVAIWSRLARSAYRLGQIEEAIEALKRQASLEGSGGVWNNLGVAYQKRGLTRRALECYTHGVRVAEPNKDRSYFLSSRNLIQLISSEENFSKVLKLVPLILSDDVDGMVARDEELSDLISMYIHSLYKENQSVIAESIAHKYLAISSIADTLAVWLVGALVSHQALRLNFDEVGSLAAAVEKKAEKLTSKHIAARESYFNNVAFAFAEKGDIESAERYMARIINSVHKTAYPTATFGLIQFRKGRVERATTLYEEAARLATQKKDKVRIKQKLNLELGKYFARENEAKARRWLDKVMSEKGGESELSKQARVVALQLSNRDGKGGR